MAGVGDEVTLRLDRFLESVKRRVEARRQPRELVIADHRDPARRLPGVDGDFLGPAGETLDRRERRAGDKGPQAGGQGDPGRRDHGEHDEDVAQ